MLGEWYLPPGKCQAISTITEGIISISHPAPLSSQTRIPQTSSPLVDKSQATQAALLQIRRSEAGTRRHGEVSLRVARKPGTGGRSGTTQQRYKSFHRGAKRGRGYFLWERNGDAAKQVRRIILTPQGLSDRA